MSDIAKRIKKLVLKESHWKVDLLVGWQTIRQLSSSQVKIEAILDKTLVLGVPHPAIAQQLSIYSKEIFLKLKEIAPSNKIERLFFQTVECTNVEIIKPKSAEQKVNGERQLSICITAPFYWKNMFLTEKELKSLDSVCCKRLKQLLQKFYARCKRKEALNAEASNSQPNTMAFVDSSFAGFLAFN
jgi:hypothetical protein